MREVFEVTYLTPPEVLETMRDVYGFDPQPGDCFVFRESDGRLSLVRWFHDASTSFEWFRDHLRFLDVEAEDGESFDEGGADAEGPVPDPRRRLEVVR